jgi:hypothetical protein
MSCGVVLLARWNFLHFCANSHGDNMFAIKASPGYRLPFKTVVVNQISFEHTHRDRSGLTWKQPMTLDIHVLAISLGAFRLPNNDNEKAA